MSPDSDRESVARNLGAKPDAQSSGPRVKPLHEKLLTGLGHRLTEGDLPLNGNGAAGWLTGGDLWLVSKCAIDTLRAHLIAEGHSGIPNRNDRIFDELQQRGILIPCNDRAIWRAKVKGDDWEHELTLIRLPTSKIWTDPATRPESFSGEVIPALAEYYSNGSATVQPNDGGDERAGKSIQDTDPNENWSGLRHEASKAKTLSARLSPEIPVSETAPLSRASIK